MTELLTGAQMRNLEQAAIGSGAVTGLDLMERAGQGVLDAVLDLWPQLADGAHRASVLCGPGNNGGDGFVIARLLQDRGWDIRLYLWGHPAKLPPDARVNHDRWCARNAVLPLNADTLFGDDRPDLIVDAIFGIGLSRPLPADLAAALQIAAHLGADGARIVAVDCPSGLDLDRGRLPQGRGQAQDDDAAPYAADLTVTFHAPKLGHYLAMGPALCGHLAVADIGLGAFDTPPAMLGLPHNLARVRLVDPSGLNIPQVGLRWPGSVMGKPSFGGHKYDHGHVVVFSGGVGRGGAARLAARAALRSGAGLVTVLCPPAALIENACHLDAIMLRALAKGQALAEVADARVTAFCMGPGMGVTELTRQRVLEVLGRRAKDAAARDPAVVLDADALSCFADDPDGLFRHLHPRCILTPHEGEFARLFPDLGAARRGALSKVDAVRQAAARAGCVLLLKGPDTVMATPQGAASLHAAVYDREVPWLATAGAGDVLAGLIAGLAASRHSADLLTMAEVAAYLHAEAARRFGPGLIADDLPEQIPAVLRNLGL
jgi:hydroxyethylthiazole kinase-like uncharacterized protein yjeF